MVHPKPASSKKQKRNSGVDFKKIRHKIGRKLPPPKNATNIQIKSKAIVLPEQSVASEREGLAVNKKGLTLRELLHQTSHHNAKSRRTALTGLKDLILKHPSELKLHMHAVIEKLRERICDNDNDVREMLYHLLRTVIFTSSKEEITATIISLLMAYIFNAMTHMAVDIRLMAFKFFELIALNYPSSFMLYAEKVLDNYVDILRNNQIYLVEKSKLKNTLGGLAHCLSLLSNKGQKDNRLAKLLQLELLKKYRLEGDELCYGPRIHGSPARYQTMAELHLLQQLENELHNHESNNISNVDIFQRRGLHTYKSEVCEDQTGIGSFSGKLEALVPVLINSFMNSSSTLRTTDVIDAQSFDCMLCTLQCINLSVKVYVGERMCTSVINGPDVMQNSMNLYMRKLWEVFPVHQLSQSGEKSYDKFIMLDMKIAEIFFHLTQRVNAANTHDLKLLEFIESLLLDSVNKPHKRVHTEKHMGALLSTIPRLLSHITSYWKARLLEAFTFSFKECKVESRLFTSYLSTLEELLFVTSNHGELMLECSHQDFQAYRMAWMRELLRILLLLDDNQPSNTMVALRLLLRIVQSIAISHDSSHIEYNSAQFSFREFFCIKTDGELIHGPFMRLPHECKELAICCLYYFPNLTEDFLESLTYCCLSSDMELHMVLRILEVLQSAYKCERVQLPGYLSFLLTLVARYEVSPGRFPVEKNHEQVANWQIYKSLTGAAVGFLCQLGDNSIILKLLSKKILSEMAGLVAKGSPALDNCHGLLRMIITLDARLTKLLDEDISNLSKLLSHYMLLAASCISEDADVVHRFNHTSAFDYYMKPCIVLFIGSDNLLHSVLRLLEYFSIREYHLLPLEYFIRDGMEISSQIHVVSSVLTAMLNYVRLHRNLSRSKASIEHILLNVQNLWDSDKQNRPYEERSKLQICVDRMKTRMQDLFQSWISDNLEGV